MTRASLILACTLAIGIVVPANAQLSNLLGGKKNDSGAATPAQVISKFVESQSLIIEAQAKFAEAFKLQDQVTLLRAEQKALTGDNVDLSAMKKSREVSNRAQSAIEARMSEQPELDKAGKGRYAEGLLTYGKGLIAAKQTLDLTAAAGRSIGLNSINDTGRAAAFVVKEAPGYFKGLKDSSRMIFAYGKRNNLAPPADATALLDGM